MFRPPQTAGAAHRGPCHGDAMNTKTPALLGLLFVLAMQTSCSTTYYSGPKSDHFDADA